MKVLALIATLLFAGVVSADSHTTAPGHADPHAAATEKKDEKAAAKDAKAPTPAAVKEGKTKK